MLYTGYFAKTKEYSVAGLYPVSVAGKTPIFFKFPKWLKFAPRKELFWAWKSGKISNEEYLKKYKEFLEETVSLDVLERIKKFCETKDVVLCCYEKPGDFCHRHALAEWLENKLQIPIGEAIIIKPKKTS